MKSMGAALHKCSRRVGAPVIGQETEAHARGASREGAGRFQAVGGVTDKKTRETLLSVGFFFM